MPEGVTTGRLSDAGFPDSLFDGSLQDRLVEVVTLLLAGLPITIELRSWEGRVGILSC
jgi:hypothetical protein